MHKTEAKTENLGYTFKEFADEWSLPRLRMRFLIFCGQDHKQKILTTFSFYSLVSIQPIGNMLLKMKMKMKKNKKNKKQHKKEFADELKLRGWQGEGKESRRDLGVEGRSIMNHSLPSLLPPSLCPLCPSILLPSTWEF